MDNNQSTTDLADTPWQIKSNILYYTSTVYHTVFNN